jgi:hypothetical protein
MPRRTLNELDPPDWGQASDGATPLIKECHVLRGKPIGQLTAGDICVLMGQRIGLEVLVPLALQRLEEEPLIEGRFYPGDLLAGMLHVGPRFWESNAEHALAVESIVGDLESTLSLLADPIAGFRSDAFGMARPTGGAAGAG